MKNTVKLFGIIAIVAVIGFAFITCDDGNNNNNNPAPLLAGKFASQNGGTGDAVFFADYVSASRSVSRAVAGMSATEKELTGKIEDGDIIFNLSGFHDTASNKFFLSAGSSFLVYEIGGTLSSSGSMSNTEATVKVKDGSDWKAITVAVTSSATDVVIAGNASAQQENGVPVSWFGAWKITMGEDSFNVIITPFQISFVEFPDQTMPFVDVTELSATKLEVIQLVEVQHGSGSNNGGSEPPTVTEWSTFEYEKMWLELTNEGLKITSFYDSVSDKDEGKGYAYTVAFDTAKALTDEEALKTQYPHYPYEDDSDDPNTINRISVLNFVRP